MPKPIRVFKAGDVWVVSLLRAGLVNIYPFHRWEDAIRMVAMLKRSGRHSRTDFGALARYVADPRLGASNP